MLPLLAIGGVIGALMSIGKGASWVADQLAPAHDATATADKSAATPQTAQAAAFETALAAQAAGQTVPGANNAVQPPSAAPATSSLPGSIIQLTHGTDYDVQARIQAGIAAYGNVGESSVRVTSAGAAVARPPAPRISRASVSSRSAVRPAA